MPGTRIQSQPRWLFMSLVVLIAFTLLSPNPGALASTDLASGDDAVIAGANGDAVRLRSKPGPSGAVLAEFPEGTPVNIIDGPMQASDGSFWYRVTVDGQAGYLAADFLAPSDPALDDPAAAPGDEPGDELVAGADSVVVAAAITGAATIVNTNGDVVRCRASASTDAEIVGNLNEGTTVQLTGNARDGWQPVICDGKNGWVHTDFIGGNDAPPAATVTAVELYSLTGTGTISGANGSGVRCRSEASTDGRTITTLAEGSTVTLRGARTGNWQPVVCASQNGFVWAAFVTIVSPGDDGNTGAGKGVIVNTDGMGLRCRKSAGFDGEILTILVEGDVVDLRGTRSGDWQPVYCDGQKGYVHGDYIEERTDDGSPDDGSGGLNTGDTARVTGTNGDGVRLRSGASSAASVITVVGEGEYVDVRPGSTGDWVAVTFQGSGGFIHKDYLTLATEGSSDDEPHEDLVDGDHAMVTSNLNFRSEPSYTASVMGIAMEGIVVLITGEARNGFFPVEWGGLPGYMHGDYLEWTSEELSPGVGGVGVGGDAGNEVGSAEGQAMVDYAKKYLGYPYIWATAGPDSFDCSGLTYWVTLHILGIDIGRGTWTQSVSGTPVSYGSLQPGDLVFFQNTYTWGLSHVGIYIGNNQFLHAENEDTGVRISSITSTYYSTRWYGAVRLT